MKTVPSISKSPPEDCTHDRCCAPMAPRGGEEGGHCRVHADARRADLRLDKARAIGNQHRSWVQPSRRDSEREGAVLLRTRSAKQGSPRRERNHLSSWRGEGEKRGPRSVRVFAWVLRPW